MEEVLEITHQEKATASQCTIRGIRMLDQINRGETVYFTAVGVGLENEIPVPCDVRWIPHSFEVGNYLRYFMFDFTESFRITRPGEHMFHVQFRKEYYDGYNWMPTKEYAKMSLPLLVV